MNDIAINVKNLTKIYHLYDKPQDRLKEALNPFKKSYHHDFYAMSDVSFEIKKGETIGIIGKNGAGKSTLLKMITGVLTPTSGTIKVNGKIASLLELGAGFNPEMTGIENIYLNGTLMGFTSEEMSAKVDAIVSFADISEFINQPVKMYSSGMFARLAFSVIINLDPDILIIDEALSVGDVFFVEKCITKIQQFIAHKDKTLIFVSHDLTVLRRIVNRVIWMENGKKKMDGRSMSVLDVYMAKDTPLSAPPNEIESDLNHISKEFLWQQKKARFGTGQAIIENVYFNQNKVDFNTINIIKTLETFTIDVSYKIVDSIENLTLSIAFFEDIQGTHCFGISPLFQNVSLDTQKKEGKIRCTFDNFQLLRGNYQVSIGLWNELIIVPYDLQERVYEVSMISEDNPEDGLFVPKYEWEVLE